MGIWEQTVGVVLQHSRDKTETLAQTLDAIPEQRHFEGELGEQPGTRSGQQFCGGGKLLPGIALVNAPAQALPVGALQANAHPLLSWPESTRESVRPLSKQSLG